MTMSETMAGPRLAGPVPPEKPLSVLGFLRTAPDNLMAAIPKSAYEQPFWETNFGPAQGLVIADPAGVKHVLLDNVANYPKAPEEYEILGAAFGEGLLTTDGEKWRAHRRIMAPSFDHKSIVSYAPPIVETTRAYLDAWERLPAGSAFDIAEEMTRLTLRIISRTMFSADADEITSLIGDTLERGSEAMTFGLADVIPVFGAWNMRRKIARIRRIFGGLDTAMYGLIEERAKRPPQERPNDLLDRLLAARDGETGVRLTNEEVRDETVIIFLAGHETTAVAMTFTFYLLSQHPAEQEKLFREVDTVLEGRAPTYEDLAKLPFTRMVVEEAMRLYPPAPGLSARRALADDVICGRRVAKGTSVGVLPWLLHRHKRLWDSPERFDPERFSPERSAGRPRFAYLPFGGGPRICIGATLAMTEACLILAMIAQRYRLSLAPGQSIELRSRITLRPVNGIRMTLEKRAA